MKDTRPMYALGKSFLDHSRSIALKSVRIWEKDFETGLFYSRRSTAADAKAIKAEGLRLSLHREESNEQSTYSNPAEIC